MRPILFEFKSSWKSWEMCVLTVKLVPAAVIILSSPASPKRIGFKCAWDVSRLADSSTCKQNFANFEKVGAVTIRGKSELVICGPLLQPLWKCNVIGELGWRALLLAVLLLPDDGLEAFGVRAFLLPFGSVLFLLPGGWIGWQLRSHQPTGNMSRES